MFNKLLPLFLLLAAVSCPRHNTAAAEPDLSATQSTTGVDSRLQSAQWARITDQATWQRVWDLHIGKIVADNTERMSIDFGESMVVAVVDNPNRKTTGIRFSVSIDDEVVLLDYQLVDAVAGKKKNRAANVFGFAVVPRHSNEMIVRRMNNGDQSFQEVARFPALRSTQAVSPAPFAGQHSGRRGALNITFGSDPGNGNHDGVWGAPNDMWNLVSMGTTAKEVMRYSDVSLSPVRMRITKHDGTWGIKGHAGIFHSYIYDNCQCVDLEATLLDVPAGDYKALVYAHGDAPNQNALIELVVGDHTVAKKATANDDSWGFRSKEFQEGVHYVSFSFSVEPGESVKFISRRDGSSYSMLNAIQLRPANIGDRSELQEHRPQLSRR